MFIDADGRDLANYVEEADALIRGILTSFLLELIVYPAIYEI